jgi:hypothetical protein
MALSSVSTISRTTSRKVPAGLPAKFFANLIRATAQPCWFCQPIKYRIMFHVFLPWKVNNSESRFDEITH